MKQYVNVMTEFEIKTFTYILTLCTSKRYICQYILTRVNIMSVFHITQKV